MISKSEYDADGKPTIYMTEVTNEQQGSERVHHRNSGGEQSASAGGEENPVRRVSEVYSANNKVQGTSGRDTDGDHGPQSDLPEVPAEVTFEEQNAEKADLGNRELPETGYTQKGTGGK